MLGIEKIPAGRIAAISLVFWLLSLTLPAIIIYGNGKDLYGLNILLLGWLSVIGFYLPWLANPFFLFAVLTIISGRSSAKVSATVAFVVSMDVIRFTYTAEKLGGEMGYIYGYGYGAFFWFLAIGLIMIAAGVREHQLAIDESSSSNKSTNPQGKLLSISGVTSVIILITLSLTLGISQRINPNSFEKEMLQSPVIFKAAPVCKVENTPPDNVIDLNGPLETPGKFSDFPRGLRSVKEILDMGIPVVRNQGFDHFYTQQNGEKILSFTKAKGMPGAILDLYNNDSDGVVSASLYTPDKKTIAFERTWTKEWIHPRYHCPSYKSFYYDDSQQRQLLLSALNINVQTPGQYKHRQQEEPRIYDDVIGIDTITDAPNLKRKWTYSCPDDVELHYEGKNDRGLPSLTFKIGDIFYKTDAVYSAAICHDNAVYLTSQPHLSGDDFKFKLQKRSLEDFSLVYKTQVRFERHPRMNYRRFHVGAKNMKIKDGVLHIEFRQEQRRTHSTIKVPLPDIKGSIAMMRENHKSLSNSLQKRKNYPGDIGSRGNDAENSSDATGHVHNDFSIGMGVKTRACRFSVSTADNIKPDDVKLSRHGYNLAIRHNNKKDVLICQGLMIPDMAVTFRNQIKITFGNKVELGYQGILDKIKKDDEAIKEKTKKVSFSNEYMSKVSNFAMDTIGELLGPIEGATIKSVMTDEFSTSFFSRHGNDVKVFLNKRFSKDAVESVTYAGQRKKDGVTQSLIKGEIKDERGVMSKFLCIINDNNGVLAIDGFVINEFSGEFSGQVPIPIGYGKVN